MEQFKNILKSKRKDAEMTQSDLAKELGIVCKTISDWELGTIPTFFAVDDVANFFKCSVDELCGRSKYEYRPFKKMREFKDILTEKMYEKGYVYETLGVASGVGLQAIWSWANGRTYPNLKHLCALSDALECSIDELMGRKL